MFDIGTSSCGWIDPTIQGKLLLCRAFFVGTLFYFVLGGILFFVVGHVLLQRGWGDGHT